MNPLVTYIVRAALYLAAFYAVYTIFLSRDTLYGRNRIFILISVILSLILPFVTIKSGGSLDFPVFRKVLSDIFIYSTPGETNTFSTGNSEMEWMRVVFTIYLAGVVLYGLKLILDISELLLLIVNNKDEGTHIIRFKGLSTAGFSAFGYVFVNSKLSQEEVSEIIRHEQYHLDRYHSVDIILLETAKVMQWFNPVIYFFSRSLRAVHEFQADAGCLDNGAPVGNYQRLLLNQVFRSKVFTVTNSFSNPTLIKKRMIMMTRKRSKTLVNLKLLMVLPVITMVMLFISSCSQSNEPAGAAIEAAPPPPPPPPPAEGISADEPLSVVEEMPAFKGGDAGLLKYLAENTKYPEAAKESGKQGKVIVRFAIEPDGSIGRVSIIKGVDPELDMEAMRVVESLPPFEKPGRQGGKAVAVWYMVPINFQLR